MSHSVVLYLSSGGDSFALKKHDHDSFRDVDVKSDRIHSYLKKAADCKTHQEVLKFLNGMKGKTGSYNCKLYHVHNRKYPSHSLNIGLGLVKGLAHECPIKKMISFVESRIKEKNSPHGLFDKIGKVLGRSFDYLSTGTVVPFLGIIPGVIRAGIGLVQTVGGVALSVIFAIPAYVCQSENAQIVVQRSVKHIGYGPLNIAIGALQGTPLLGTWIYYNTH